MNNQKKIAFFAGHGGADNGATGVNGVHEDDKTLLVTKECIRLANAIGHKTITNRTSDVDSSIDSKVAYANAQNVNAILEIHLNAFDGTAKGTETYYDHEGGISKTLALKIDAQLVAEGFRDRGIKVKLSTSGNDYFGIIRLSKAPAVLIECCFIDNKEDMSRFNPTKMAQAIIDGILEVFPAPIKAAPPAPQKPINLYAKGRKISLKNTPLFSGSSDKISRRQVSGNYYLWDGKLINGKYRITNTPEHVGLPEQVTGWILKGAIK